jgi:two-component system, NarL family, invasion response regulator UvrY
MNILIADDHPIIVESLKRILAAQFNHATVFSTDFSKQIIPLIEKHDIQFLILDIQLLDGNALKVLEDLRARNIRLPILIFSTVQLKSGFLQYSKDQVWAIVDKGISNSDLRKVIFNFISQKEIHTIQSAHVVMPVEGKQSQDFTRGIFTPLSKNEMMVMEMLVNGTSIKEIAFITNKKNNTIATYKRRIFQKLNIRKLIDLIDLARQHRK